MVNTIFFTRFSLEVDLALILRVINASHSQLRQGNEFMLVEDFSFCKTIVPN